MADKNVSQKFVSVSYEKAANNIPSAKELIHYRTKQYASQLFTARIPAFTLVKFYKVSPKLRGRPLQIFSRKTAASHGVDLPLHFSATTVTLRHI